MKKNVSVAESVWSAVILITVSCLFFVACGRNSTQLAEKGSLWTDGQYGFEVVESTPDSLLMECRSEYGRGMDIVMACGEDGGWRIDGAGGFGFHGSPVRKVVLSGKELLIASYPKDADDYLYDEGVELRAGKPMQVLERFDGDMTSYELMAVRRFLTGVYTDMEDTSLVWTFLPDGTVSTGEGKTPMPYQVESGYRGLTNVVRLPDGGRWEFVLDGQCLYLSAVRWNGEYSFWEADTVVARRMDYEPDLNWLREQLFCSPIQGFLHIGWMEELEKRAKQSDDDFVRLNAAVIATSRNEGSL